MVTDTIMVVLVVATCNTDNRFTDSFQKADSIFNARIELFKKASKEAVKSAERKTYKFFPYKTIYKKEK